MTRNEKKAVIESMAEKFMNIDDLEGKSMTIERLPCQAAQHVDAVVKFTIHQGYCIMESMCRSEILE